MLKQKKIIIIFVFAVMLAGAFLSGCLIERLGWEKTVVPPTCTEKGYTIYQKDGKTQIKQIVDAIGHSFNDWLTVRDVGEIACGVKEHTCGVCGFKEEVSVYPRLDIPRISLEGDISEIGKTMQVKVGVEFLMEDGSIFEGYALIKHQGHSSLQYDKKNYTVKFFDDEACKQKRKFEFFDWNAENKFILKANYIDISRSRNLICADVWSDMVSSRTDVPERLLSTSNNGAVDGYPIALYLNDEFIGLYCLTLHKDDDLFAMEDGRKDGIAIINKGNTAEALFEQRVDWDASNDWEIEYCGTENDAWIKEKLNRFIDFVMTSSDEEFRSCFSEYADVNSMIDYMIAMYSLGLYTSYAKDLLLFTYDDGPWTASLFDMENAFGILEDEKLLLDADQYLPKTEDGKWDSGTESLLWDRFIHAFYGEIKARYITLRDGALNEDALLQIVDKRIDSIPEYINNADLVLYPDQPMQSIGHKAQIKDYLCERLIQLDLIFK